MEDSNPNAVNCSSLCRIDVGRRSDKTKSRINYEIEIRQDEVVSIKNSEKQSIRTLPVVGSDAPFIIRLHGRQVTI